MFCPALTDGSLGDMMYFHTYKADPAPLNVDIVGDIRRLNDMSVKAKQAGMIILGGGVCKHQIANAMLFVSWGVPMITDVQRNGADYAVYINTGQEYDGSDSGARPDEAVSWGKIRANAQSVKVSFSFANLADQSGLRRCHPGLPSDRGQHIWQGPLGGHWPGLRSNRHLEPNTLHIDIPMHNADCSLITRPAIVVSAMDDEDWGGLGDVHEHTSGRNPHSDLAVAVRLSPASSGRKSRQHAMNRP